MSLDEKITWCPSKTGVRIAKIIEVKDVKQFIKELKEEIIEKYFLKGYFLSIKDVKLIINKLAGKGLI